MKKHLLIFMFIFTNMYAFSQDVHFSNYSAVPLFLNPATTGMFDGSFRLTTAYRNQWGRFSNPYNTFYSSFDYNFSNNKPKKSILGAGLSFYNDKAGTTQMGNSQVNLSLGCNIILNDKHTIGGGLKTGIGQMSYNPNVRWGNQYSESDGSVDVSLPSGEMNMNTSVTYFNYGAGILWNFSGENNLKSNAGIAVNKILSQQVNGMQDDNLKLSFHSTTQVPLNNSLFILPYISYILNGVNTETNLGAILKYDSGLNSRYTGRNFASAIYLGTIYRFQDAIIIITKMDMKKFLSLSLCYDINVSPLKIASRGNGGLEISISYMGLSKSGKSGKSNKTFL